MNKTIGFFLLMAGTSMLGACARQSTPSMMNTSRPQLMAETSMQQVPVKNVQDGYLSMVADNYARYGASSLQLSLAYDPDSKTYGTVPAFKDLAKFKSRLEQFGVRGITAETVKSQGEPTLMVSYDAVKAEAPAGCRNMPGFDDGLTTEKVGDYRFGCSIDTVMAKQLYRPSDLQGYAGHDAGDGRRAAQIVDYNRQVTPEEAEGDLNRMDRSTIQGQ